MRPFFPSAFRRAAADAMLFSKMSTAAYLDEPTCRQPRSDQPQGTHEQLCFVRDTGQTPKVIDGADSMRGFISATH